MLATAAASTPSAARMATLRVLAVSFDGVGHAERLPTDRSAA